MEEPQVLPWSWGQWGVPAPRGQADIASKQWMWRETVAPAGALGFPHAWGKMSSPQPQVSPQGRDPKDPQCGCTCWGKWGQHPLPLWVMMCVWVKPDQTRAISYLVEGGRIFLGGEQG